jgi:hypothetical protein
LLLFVAMGWRRGAWVAIVLLPLLLVAIGGRGGVALASVTVSLGRESGVSATICGVEVVNGFRGAWGRGGLAACSLRGVPEGSELNLLEFLIQRVLEFFESRGHVHGCSQRRGSDVLRHQSPLLYVVERSNLMVKDRGL